MVSADTKQLILQTIIERGGYEQAARLLDLRNLNVLQVSVVMAFISQQDPAGSVYAAYQASTSLIKIGRSANVPRRLQALIRQYGTPLKLLASAHCPCSVVAVEHWLHTYFQPVRVAGEWFACDTTMFTEPYAFVNLVGDAHYEIVRTTWHDLIIRKLAGSWVLDKEKVHQFMSM